MKINREKLSLAMARACVSAKDLQRESGICDITLCRIQNGTQQARPKTIGRLAVALKVDVAELIEEA